MTLPVSVGELFEGRYRIEGVLGKGGMGVVVEAVHEQLDRRVAIKFLLPELSSHEEVRRRFIREARAAARLESEHVAHVLDVVETEEGLSYMVIEFLDGENLEDLLEKGGQFEVTKAVDYLLEACEALVEAHRHGIVHRDLKPSNLFLSKRADGSQLIKVLDFGISKISTKESMALTQDADVLGSPLYMSPEQIRSSKNVDPRSDIWALGVVLFKFLAGDEPFPGETIQEVMSKVLFEPPPSIREFRDDVPPELENVINKCLAKNPEERYQNLAELAIDLEPFGTPEKARASVERIVAVQKSTAYKETKPSLDLPDKPGAATKKQVGVETGAKTVVAVGPSSGSSDNDETADDSGDVAATKVDSGAGATNAALSKSLDHDTLVDGGAGGKNKTMVLAGAAAAVLVLGIAVFWMVRSPGPGNVSAGTAAGSTTEPQASSQQGSDAPSHAESAQDAGDGGEKDASKPDARGQGAERRDSAGSSHDSKPVGATPGKSPPAPKATAVHPRAPSQATAKTAKTTPPAKPTPPAKTVEPSKPASKPPSKPATPPPPKKDDNPLNVDIK